MKLYAKKIHVVLGLAILTQVGCNGGKGLGNQQGYLYPNVATQQQDHSAMGDAFRTSQTGLNGGANQTGWTNALNTMARNLPGATPTGTTPAPTGDGTTPKKDGTDGAGDGGNDEATKFTVKIDQAGAWKKACSDLAGEDAIKRSALDTDGDGISDACEDALVASKDGNWIGLDKTVYNGALVVAKKFFDEKNKWFKKDVVPMCKGTKAGTWVCEDSALQSIRLTESENSAWKQAKDLGGFGDGVDSKFDRQIVKKFFARSVIGGNDMAALRDMMSLQQIQIQDNMQTKDDAGKVLTDQYKPYFQAADQNKIAKTGISNGLKGLTAYSNSQAVAAVKMEDLPQFALVKNNAAEMIPFPLTKDGYSVAFLSGIHRDAAQTLRSSKEFMYVAETHLVIPESVGDGMEIRVGNLVSDRTQAVAGSRAGMFFVIHNNETDIITTELIKSNLTGTELKASMNTIGLPTNCTTVHLAIAFLADSQKVAEGAQKAIFAENVFYHETKEDVWKPIPQEWMRLQALDKNATQKCEVSADEIVMQEARDYMKVGKTPLQ